MVEKREKDRKGKKKHWAREKLRQAGTSLLGEWKRSEMAINMYMLSYVCMCRLQMDICLQNTSCLPLLLSLTAVFLAFTTSLFLPSKEVKISFMWIHFHEIFKAKSQMSHFYWLIKKGYCWYRVDWRIHSSLYSSLPPDLSLAAEICSHSATTHSQINIPSFLEVTELTSLDWRNDANIAALADLLSNVVVRSGALHFKA